ncbi:AAA family ATPase [Candidatus Woesearchaeota archaeon CG11_big_fil_rev_8_21_14_0_20_57_5]|nr:MAG: AAA family ATPase [Candidatus Woesearchaeota archaeon CG11_big_fil_rev_8_21_14_0_20_57_5]
MEFNPEAVEIKDDKVLEVTYEDIGGLEQEITKIREMVELPIKHPELFERLGIDPPKGVLLHGPPGTGKTLLAKAVATETNANFILINGPEIMSKYYGQSEENLRKKFEEAEQNAPSIIFIDEIDAIASKREESRGEVERRVVAQLLAIMDGLKARGKVVVIAATNIPNLLDPALRRPGRFDRELEISVPNKEGRLRILKIHTRNMPLAPQNISTDVIANILRRNVQEAITKLQDDQKTNGESHETELTVLRNLEKDIKDNKGTLTKVARQVKKVAEKSILEEDDLSKIIMESLEGNEKEMAKAMLDAELITLRTIEQTRYESSARELEAMAAITHGFVGADLAALAKESAMIVLRRLLPEIRLDDEERIPRELLEKLRITQKDFQEALKVVRPSALREVLVENPNVAWEDIGGLEEVKQELKEAVEWPLQHPDAFKRLGVRPPKGILLYGAPGSGKTMLAKAVATEAESNFIVVKGPELLSKWVGESEKAVREIFKKARTVSPSIIFFDEIDSIAPRRGASSDSHVTERVVNQLLTEMDGLVGLHDIVIIGATNRPDMLDTALLRPGRFDRIILTPAPDKGSRLEIFKVHTKSMPLASDVKLETLAKDTEGYVGADIESVCREAAMLALRENMNAKEIKKKHFTEALKRVRPSVSKEVEETYAQLKEHFSSAQAEEMKVERPSYMG